MSLTSKWCSEIASCCLLLVSNPLCVLAFITLCSRTLTLCQPVLYLCCHLCYGPDVVAIHSLGWLLYSRSLCVSPAIRIGMLDGVHVVLFLTVLLEHLCCGEHKAVQSNVQQCFSERISRAVWTYIHRGLAASSNCAACSASTGLLYAFRAGG